MTTTDITITQNAGTPEVHATGCAHLKRARVTRNGEETMQATSREDIVRELFADFISSDEDVDYYMDEVKFLPCCKL